MTLTAEIKRNTVRVHKNALFTVFGVDLGSDVFRRTPLPIHVHVAIINVLTTQSGFLITHKKETFSIKAQTHG